MLEIQGPGGRYRLGEIIHGEETPRPDDKLENEKGPVNGDGEKAEDLARDSPEGESCVTGESGRSGEKDDSSLREDAAAERLSELMPGESVSMDVSAEMKEVGLQILICSVAWETLDGRRTFQRFFKFNVGPGSALIPSTMFPSSRSQDQGLWICTVAVWLLLVPPVLAS
jgi:hypothetical protein